jgi:hypothetical protein
LNGHHHPPTTLESTFSDDHDLCDALLGKEHAYRKLGDVFDVRALAREFAQLDSDIGAVAIPVEKGIRALIRSTWRTTRTDGNRPH